LVKLQQALDTSSLWESTKLAIEFQLLTGARPTEVRLTTWKEINDRRNVWTIPPERVKSGREFRVHLSVAAMAILERAKVISGPKVGWTDQKRNRSEFIFPGMEGGALEKMAIARALSRLAERTKDDGGKKFRPHDLRRTFRTMLSRIGVAPHIAELCMNHQETETMRRVYDGHDYFGEMADAWERAGEHIKALRKGAAVVVPIGGARAA
jgi:integrase